MRLEVLNDKELVRQYISGNEAAFEQLLNRHKRKIWSHINIMVRDRDITEDIFQDAFIKVVQKLKAGKYNEEGKFLPWVMRIAHNLTIDHFRRAKKMPMNRSNDQYDVFATVSQPDLSIEDEMVNDQIDEDVRRLISELPQEQREVVIMRTYLKMSFKEISERTDVSINTALGRMRYALINMRKMVSENAIDLERA